MTQTVVNVCFFLVSLRQALHYQDVILVVAAVIVKLAVRVHQYIVSVH